MKKQLLVLIAAVALSSSLMAEDHVMAATKSHQPQDTAAVPSTLNLSLREAQAYAVQQNRTLRNASLAVQHAERRRPRFDRSGRYQRTRYCWGAA